MFRKINRIYKNIFEPIIISVFLCFVLLNFVFMPVTVDGTSMVSKLQDGDRGLSFIFPKCLSIDPKRFDIVVIDTDLNENLLVKRIIGLPNEHIEYRDNCLYINGEYVKEEFLDDKYTYDFEYYLEDDEYFCLGDNRQVSRDSRYYGPFSKDEIVSYGIFVFYPFNNFGIKR